MKDQKNLNVLLVVFVGCCLLCFYPALKVLIDSWLSNEDYTHAFFVVPIIIFMFWQQREKFAMSDGHFASALLCFVCLGLYFIALQSHIYTIVFFIINLFIMSCFVYLYSLGSLRYIITPLILLFMIIPIPNQILSIITYELQLRVSEVSEIVVRGLGIAMLREGNILHIQDKSFQVVDACSGIRSLISMTTLAVIVGYFSFARIFSKLLLFCFSVPVAVFINILRVVGMILLYHYFHIDVAEGTLHSTIGLLLFFVGLAILFSLQRILEIWEKNKVN